MEDYCTFEQSIKLKELGFDYPVRDAYLGNGEILGYHPQAVNFNSEDGLISQPTLSQAQKWLRTKDIHIEIMFEKVYKDKQLCDIWLTTIDKMTLYEAETLKERFHTYEQALSAGIDKALELLK